MYEGSYFSHGELLCGLCIGIVLLQITVLANLRRLMAFCSLVRGRWLKLCFAFSQLQQCKKPSSSYFSGKHSTKD